VSEAASAAEIVEAAVAAHAVAVEFPDERAVGGDQGGDDRRRSPVRGSRRVRAAESSRRLAAARAGTDVSSS
jgi:hypothetical protein